MFLVFKILTPHFTPHFADLKEDIVVFETDAAEKLAELVAQIESFILEQAEQSGRHEQRIEAQVLISRCRQRLLNGPSHLAHSYLSRLRNQPIEMKDSISIIKAKGHLSATVIAEKEAALLILGIDPRIDHSLLPTYEEDEFHLVHSAFYRDEPENHWEMFEQFVRSEEEVSCMDFPLRQVQAAGLPISPVIETAWAELKADRASKRPLDNPYALEVQGEGLESKETHAALKAELAANKAELAQAKGRIQGLETDLVVNPKTKASLQKMVLGMAIEQYGYDPSSSRNAATADIVSDLALQGLSIDPNTVRTQLSSAYQAHEALIFERSKSRN